jgi:hypothetical protein
MYYDTTTGTGADTTLPDETLLPFEDGPSPGLVDDNVFFYPGT